MTGGKTVGKELEGELCGGLSGSVVEHKGQGMTQQRTRNSSAQDRDGADEKPQGL